VKIAEPDLLPSDTDVATIVTINVAAAEGGAVYVTAVPDALDSAERVPQIVAVHAAPGVVRVQVTPPVFPSFWTLAVNGNPTVLPAGAFASGGVTVTEIGGVTVIAAVSDAVVSDTEVAVSVTGNVAAAEAGAVYVMAVPLALDAADKLPHGVGPIPVQVRPVDESDQFTPPIFGSLLTVGLNVIPVGLLAATFAVLGVIETAMLFVKVMFASVVRFGVAVVSVACKITIAGFVTPVPASGITFGAVYVTLAPAAVPLLIELVKSIPHVVHATDTGTPPAPC
jgi:hypothetical protein